MRRIARALPERKAIQVRWLEALVSLFSFRRVSRNRVITQTTDAQIALSFSWK